MLFGLGLVLVFGLSLAYRILINRERRNVATPDEKTYSSYALTWRPGKSYTKAIDAFLAKPTLEIPPTRFGFFALCRAFNRHRANWTLCFRPTIWISAVSAALLAPIAYLITRDLPSSLLVASSPLSLFLSRRALQDSFSALWLLAGLGAIQLHNPWLLGVAVMLALTTREALLLYLPAFLVAWGLKTGQWVSGGVVLTSSVVASVALYYAVGGRRLLDVFRKLKQPTDYVRRFQSGPAHRLLVDMFLVSPVVAAVALTNWTRSPLWLLGFTGIALGVHSFITPKNIRFLLIVDVCTRMLCCGLPGPWPWVVLVVSSAADLWLYWAFGKVEDPVTANLVVKSGMYLEK